MILSLIIFYKIQVNSKKVNVGFGFKEALLIDEKDELFKLKHFKEDRISDQKAKLGIESQIAHSVEKTNVDENVNLILHKPKVQNKLKITIEENKSLDVELQNELNLHTEFIPLVPELKFVNVDLIQQESLNVEQNELNLKEQQFVSKENLPNVCKTDFSHLNQSKIISEAIVSSKENELVTHKPNESNANLGQQLNQKSLQVSENSILDTCKNFEKIKEIPTVASIDLIENKTLCIQDNLVNETEKMKKIENPKKKKLRISVLTKEAVIVKQLDQCQKEEKFSKLKLPESEKISQNLTPMKAKQISTVNLFENFKDASQEIIERKNVSVDLLTNQSINILETESLSKEEFKKDAKVSSKKIKPKLNENRALEVREINEQLNENEFTLKEKIPVEANLNFTSTKIISKSKEQIFEKEKYLNAKKLFLEEVNQTTLPNISFNVSLNEHEEKEEEIKIKPFKIKKASKKTINKKGQSLEVQENQLEETTKPFDSVKLDHHFGAIKFEPTESISISLQEPTQKEQLVEFDKPKLVAAKKRKEFKKSRSLAIQKAESLEKEDKFLVEKPKLEDTKNSIEIFNCSLQEQFYSFDSLNEFVPETMNLKTGNVTIEKSVASECDEIQLNEQLNKLDNFIKPREHTAKESVVEELLKQTVKNKVDSIEDFPEDYKPKDDQMEVNLKKQPKLGAKNEETESLEEKTKITIEKRKKKILNEIDQKDTIKKLVEEETEKEIHPRKITVESIQNEVDVHLRPKQSVKLDSKKQQETSEVSIDQGEKFMPKSEKKEYIHTFEKDGDKISTIENESTTDLHAQITVETKKKRPQYEAESEIEEKTTEEKIRREVDDNAIKVELVENIETQIGIKSKKKPKFEERLELKPGKTEPVYNMAKEENAPEECFEKTVDLDQPKKLEKHASTSIENLKNIQIDETKTAEKETELKPEKKKKRVKILIPTKEARQFNEADHSIIAAEIKADKYYSGM